MPVEWSGLAPELLLALDRHSGDPLHSQLEGRLREAIRSGVVSPCGTSPARRTAGSSTPDLFRSRNSSLPRGSLSLSGSRYSRQDPSTAYRSSSTRRWLAAAAQAPTRATALSG